MPELARLSGEYVRARIAHDAAARKRLETQEAETVRRLRALADEAEPSDGRHKRAWIAPR